MESINKWWDEFEHALDSLTWQGKLALFSAVIIAIVFLGFALYLGGSPPFVAPVAQLPEGHLVIRPIWHSKDTIPSDLYRQSAPAIVIDPDDYQQKKILTILGAEGPGEYDPKKIPNLGEQLMAWGDKARPPLWFQPSGCTELLPGRWSELILSSSDRELLQRWFEEADLIIVEET